MAVDIPEDMSDVVDLDQEHLNAVTEQQIEEVHKKVNELVNGDRAMAAGLLIIALSAFVGKEKVCYGCMMSALEAQFGEGGEEMVHHVH